MDAQTRLIGDYMTPTPHTIGKEQSLAKASEMMRKYGFRHLPVLAGGVVVGMLSERDIALVEALPGLDAEKVTVEDAMSQTPYTATPSTPLSTVAEEMARHRYGAVIVVDREKVVGVFTSVDACRVLATLC